MPDLQPCADKPLSDELMIEGLSEEQQQAILRERMLRFQKQGNQEETNLEEMIVFLQAGSRYAVPLYVLSEIRPIANLTCLPMVNPAILGVINVRGRIITIYSMQDEVQEKALSGFALVGQGIAEHLAMWAEDILGTLKVDTNDIKPLPVALQSRDYIRGVGSDGMIYLDVNKIIQNSNMYMA